MLLEPQSLTQHFLQCGTDTLVLVAGDRLDLAARCAQSGFQGVGGIQQAGQGAMVAIAATWHPPSQGHSNDNHNSRD